MVLDHEICLSVTWDRFKALISADGIDCILRDGLSETGPLDLKVSTISAAQATEPRLKPDRCSSDIFDRLSARPINLRSSNRRKQARGAEQG